MPRKRIPDSKIKRILVLHAIYDVNKSEIARSLNLSRNTIRDYVDYYEDSDVCCADILTLPDKMLANFIIPETIALRSEHRISLESHFSALHDESIKRESSLKEVWEEYRIRYSSAYCYSHFVSLYHRWREENRIKVILRNKWMIERITEEDARILSQWRRSNQRGMWERAVAILELHNGVQITRISKKIERSCRTIRRWRARFIDNGVENLDLRRSRKIKDDVTEHILRKKKRLIELIHESPHVHSINRTSWSLKTLAQAYEAVYGESISKSTISAYVRSEGYTFKKAKKVLTSPDPEYRTKLANITRILSNLGAEEKFFSIDEFGPVAIRIRGGKALCHKGQARTIPQRQKSKGSVICTAALELSTNQVTHFYSDKKNTVEMIKLLEMLIDEYSADKQLFFSWDAASWHASKKLYEKVDEINDPEYRRIHKTPKVDLAPLPSSAQFLNVIESVFSGLARAVIHNSNYQSVDECKAAIDRYFSERNQAFKKNPKRAGKKIWGEEVVKPVFSAANNCKDRRWR